MKIAYFGTPVFSATLLEQLILDKSLGVKISLVVTQPDKQVGKKQVLTPSPVKVIARKHNIEIWDHPITELNDKYQTSNSQKKHKSEDVGFFAPRAVKDAPVGDKKDNIELFNKLRGVDFAIVFAFGFKQLIPLDLLKAPKIQFKIGEDKTSGFVNIHPSLLPRYRGASPIAYPILLGKNKTGVTLFVMDEKMDHGPVLAQVETEIRLNDVRPDMEKKLTDMGLEMTKKFLSVIASPAKRGAAIPLPTSTSSINGIASSPTAPRNDKIILQPQDDTLMTRAPFMTREDGFVPFSTLCKALKNEAITAQELPRIIRNYFSRHPGVGRDPGYNFHLKNDVLGLDSRLRGNDIVEESLQNLLQNSTLTIYNFWRGMFPWPGIWTKVMINGHEKRLKIVKLSLLHPELPITSTSGRSPFGRNYQLQINTVQLEGKNEVDFPTFQKAYKIF